MKNKINGIYVIMEIDICPYKVLNVQKNCNMVDLKQQYKKLAMQYHPDKGGNKYLFDLLTISFKKVYNNLQAESDHNTLKQKFQTKSSDIPTLKNFNLKDGSFEEQFNKHFDKHKLTNTSTERGYASFMNESEVKTSKKNYKLKKYQPPEPLISTKLNFEELGVDVQDFSGRNYEHNLNYMDYQYAHTTSKLIDHDQVKSRKSFNSLKELETKRSLENFELTDNEKMYYEKMKTKKDRQEQKRITNMNHSDKAALEHFQKVNNLQIT